MSACANGRETAPAASKQQQQRQQSVSHPLTSISSGLTAARLSSLPPSLSSVTRKNRVSGAVVAVVVLVGAMMHAMPQHGAMPAHVGAGYSVPSSDGSSNMPGSGSGSDGSENRKHDIAEILQQIMNITDQSLDEAQARSVAVSHGLVTTFVFSVFSSFPFAPSPMCHQQLSLSLLSTPSFIPVV